MTWIDPKPELSISTLMTNLGVLDTRMEIARLAYSKAYLEWLHLGEQIKNRLAEEQMAIEIKTPKL